jgi:hypothetical protein
MPQYLNIENQRILWNAISMNPDFDKCDINKRDWFETILSNFNTKFESPDITTQELMLLNRETIDYMVQYLKSAKNVKSDDFQTFSNDSHFTSESFLVPQVIQEKNMRSEHLDKKFSSIQEEYKALNFRPVPQEIDFRYKDKDEPIMDMEILLQQHMKDRNLLESTPSTRNQTEFTSKGPVKLTILSDIINLDVPIHDLDTNSVSQKRVEFKKNVSWSQDDNLREDRKEDRKEDIKISLNNESLEPEIKWLKELYIGLRQEMDELKRELGK